MHSFPNAHAGSQGKLTLLLLLLLLSSSAWLQLAAASTPAPPCHEGGFYLVSSAPSTRCEVCPEGSSCDEGVSIRVLCPAGTYQPLKQQVACLDCPEGFACPSQGTANPTACPNSTITPARSRLCGTECDYENFFYHTATRSCRSRTVICDYSKQFEVPNPLNRTSERVCRGLTPCNTARFQTMQSPIFGGPEGVEGFLPLQEYITRYHTRYSDRACERWTPCGVDDYVEQLPVDDGQGFLVQPMVCKRLTPRPSFLHYRLVDGSSTRDRDNVWARCTSCDPDSEFQLRACSLDADVVCQVKTTCDSRYEYIQRLGSFNADNVCAPKTKCTAGSERAMYERIPPIDSTSFYQNGSNAVCANYSQCASGFYQSFAGGLPMRCWTTHLRFRERFVWLRISHARFSLL